MSKDLFDKFQFLKDGVAGLKLMGGDPFSVTMEKVTSPTEAVINGKPTVLFGTNNYLGLTFDPAAQDAAIDAIRNSGVGTTGSRVANGTYGLHKELERAVARFMKRDRAMVFTTGYQANLGFLSGVVGRDEYILIDGDSHASIYDACKMSDATVIRFRHNDMGDLERKLAKLGAGDRNKLVVVEGIYSMLGDRAPLTAVTELTQKYNAYLAVDEAHSLGVLGEHGRGLAEEEGVEDKVDFVLGTFSKSVATIGGFCASNHPDLDILRMACRSYLFTASLPPSIAATAIATLKIMEERPQLFRRLRANTEAFYGGLARLGYSLGPEANPVVAVKLPGLEALMAAWRGLLDRGIYVNLAMPPATPANTYLLRCSVCAAHTDAQIAKALAAFADLKQHLNLPAAAE
jgi:7-keto-8-aminopelargonate synthetase-like enzyme